MSGSQAESLNNNTQADGVASTTADTTAESPPSLWESIDPKVIDLIYWRDVQKSALLLSFTLVTLLSFAMFSVLSVVAYASLIVLTVTLSFRVYKNIKAAVYKTGEGHPFQRYLDMDISFEQSTLNNVAAQLSTQFLDLICGLRRLFLVEDLVDSLKFYALLYLLTYVGSMFNATTLVILADVALFSLPKIYEIHQVEINQAVNQVRTKIQTVIDQVKQQIRSSGLKKYL